MRDLDHGAVTVKLLGAALLLAAAFALSQTLCADARASLARIEAYVTLIRRIRGQIDGFCRPIGEILRRLEADLLSACGLGLPTGEGMEAMLADRSLGLPPEGERIVREFAAELGRGYLDEQLAVCDRALHALDELAVDARQRLPERLRIIRCACFCSVGAIILLFL